MKIAPDRIHPNQTGHLLIARAVLAGLDQATSPVSVAPHEARLPGTGEESER